MARIYLSITESGTLPDTEEEHPILYQEMFLVFL